LPSFPGQGAKDELKVFAPAGERTV